MGIFSEEVGTHESTWIKLSITQDTHHSLVFAVRNQESMQLLQIFPVPSQPTQRATHYRIQQPSSRLNPSPRDGARGPRSAREEGENAREDNCRTLSRGDERSRPDQRTAENLRRGELRRRPSEPLRRTATNSAGETEADGDDERARRRSRGGAARRKPREEKRATKA